MTLITALLFAVLLAVIFMLVLPARTIATVLRSIGPIALGLAGLALVLLKQGMLGGLLIFGAISLWRRSGGFGVGQMGGGKRSNRVSSVRSAALEMELDHESGAMNGMVLAGRHEGEELDNLDLEDLLDIRSEITSDTDSLVLLDAYLDRRFPAWREDADTDGAAGQGDTARTGPMGEQEAYEVLGLAAGATVAEIREAHRRLMKTAHPDSGGSTFLASKINEAKDVLLKSHS